MTQPKETWHSHYDDPRDDLVLISNDNIKFRVSSHRLAKVSTVFKDMIGLPGSSSLDPIPLDHPALTIQNFLNITTTMSGDMLLPAMSFKSAFAFLEFSHQFGCDQWLPKAKGAIFRAADRDPIAIFDFAADNDDWARGQGAVSHLGSGPMRSTFKESGACFEQWLEQKPIEWQLALLRAIVYNTPYLRFNTSWGYAGQSFVRPAEFKKRKRNSLDIERAGKQKGPKK